MKSQSVQPRPLKQAVTNEFVANPKLLVNVKINALSTDGHDAGLLAFQIQLVFSLSSIDLKKNI
jgi:hypothetical protein